ncbi:MAG: hypothetical protein JNK29_05250 [Anaerolineales bacterium]|nr:hypothetical protein [Anaerolineales bacterium]
MPPVSLALAELDAALKQLWETLAWPPAAAGAGGPPVAWRAAYTPLLPADWPPGAATAWVRYGFAYGQEVSLRDGARVARPWVRVEIQGDQARLTALRTALEPCAVQGVRPLRAAELARLQAGAEAEGYARGLRGLPQPPGTDQFRAYYRLWAALNGAVVPALPPEHTPFFQWLEAP